MNKKRILSIFLTSSLVMGNNSFVLAAQSSEKVSNNKAISISNYEINENNKIKSNITIAAYDNQDDDIMKNVSIKQEAAKEIAVKSLKKYFETEITEDYKCSANLYDYNENGKTKYYWNIRWSLNNYENDIYIYSVIDANEGTIKSIDINDYSDSGQSSIPTITYDEAEEIGKKFADKINAKKIKECELQNTNWTSSSHNSTNYYFLYNRVVNGIKFEGNSISVTVDGITGKVTSYNYSWDDDLEFPSPDNIVNKDIAIQSYKDDFNTELVYRKYNNKYEYQDVENKKNVMLIYESELENGTVLDAKTGKPVDWYKNDDTKWETKQLSKKEIEKFYNKYKKIDRLEKAMEKNEASKLISQLIKSIYGKGFAIEDLNFYDDEWEQKSTWSAHFVKESKKEEERESGYISIDALTGQIVSINKYGYYDYDEEFKPAVSWEEGYNKAIGVLGEYFSDKIKNIDLTQTRRIYDIKNEEEYIPERYYYYTFTRKVDEIPYEHNYISIEINAKTGEISKMRCYWEDDIEFIDKKGNIGENKVKEIVFNKYKPELNYVLRHVGDDKKTEMKMEIVYNIKGFRGYSSFADMDAFSGSLLNYDGEEIIDDIEVFLKEIKGSYAEREIKILAYNGIIDTRNFVLKKEVSKKDLIKVLVDALGYRPYVVEEGLKENSNKKSFDSDVKEDKAFDESQRYILSEEDYLKMAEYYGLMNKDEKKFDIDEKVTREDMGKALVKFLNYDNIAEIKGIFAMNCEDGDKVSEENIGYTAIAKGLELLQLKDNKIKPKDNATIEELCIGLYNTLLNSSKTNDYIPILYR
jgi:hypothetical protein